MIAKNIFLLAGGGGGGWWELKKVLKELKGDSQEHLSPSGKGSFEGTQRRLTRTFVTGVGGGGEGSFKY